MNRRDRRRAARQGKTGQTGAGQTGAGVPSSGVGETLRQALALHQAGDLDAAARLYRQVLRRDPDNAGGQHLYGLLHIHTGEPAVAVEHLGQALHRDPGNATAHAHMAEALAALERWAEAETHLRRALELRPDFAEARNNLGNVLDARGCIAEAAEEYARALDLSPEFAEARNNLGTVRAKAGRFEEAVAEYERALALRPDYAEAHGNLGNVLNDLGRFEEAVSAYRKALALGPESAGAHANIAASLGELGHQEEALEHFQRALALDPDTAEARGGLVSLLSNVRVESYRPALDGVLADCFAAPGVRHEDLAGVTARHLRLKHDIADADEDAEPDAALVDALAENQLFLTFLRSCVNMDAGMERLLSALRRTLLFDPLTAEEAGPDHDPDRLPLLAALARQCLNNEHIFSAGPDEWAAVAELESRIAAGDFDPPSAGLCWRLMLVALYRPLHRLDARETLEAVRDDSWPPALRPVIRAAIHDRVEEAQIAARLPAIGELLDETSRAVAAQYEENPYPRWMSAVHAEPESPAAAMRRRLPHVALPAALDGPVEILVAGCGTGQHPIVGVAQTFKGSRVLAVDLSRASLAYAARMARKMDVGNIEFLRADILNLGALDRRFQIVECAGVLHHMEDPVAGWRVLVDLLAPDGLMLIGLYSEAARRDIVAARRRIETLGLGAGADDIRAFRARILDGDEGEALMRLADWPDFYSTSGCRDLLFHAREHRFTIPRIAESLDDLALDFLGFEFPSAATKRLYRAECPDDPEMTDLASWDKFETRHPDAFAAMYTFWCRRREG